MDVSDLCIGKSISDLEQLADWSYLCSKDDSLEEYWAERDGFEAGVQASGQKVCMASVLHEEDGYQYEMILLFVGDYEVVKNKIQNLTTLAK